MILRRWTEVFQQSLHVVLIDGTIAQAGNDFLPMDGNDGQSRFRMNAPIFRARGIIRKEPQGRRLKLKGLFDLGKVVFRGIRVFGQPNGHEQGVRFPGGQFAV